MSLLLLLNPKQYIHRAAQPIAARRARADKKRKPKKGIIDKAEDLVTETFEPVALQASAFTNTLLEQLASYVELQSKIEAIQLGLRTLARDLEREATLKELERIKQIRLAIAKRIIEMQEEEEAMLMLLLD